MSSCGWRRTLTFCSIDLVLIHFPISGSSISTSEKDTIPFPPPIANIFPPKEAPPKLPFRSVKGGHKLHRPSVSLYDSASTLQRRGKTDIRAQAFLVREINKRRVVCTAEVKCMAFIYVLYTGSIALIVNTF